MGPRGIYIYNNMIITKYMYNIKHTSFQPQVKLYMYNEYYVKKTFYRKRNCVMEQYKT